MLAAAADTPQRVVSINLCTDELVLALAHPDQVRSVSYVVKDPAQSTWAFQAKAYPANYNRIEEIVQLRPDLVVANYFSGHGVLPYLQQQRVTTLIVPQIHSFAELKLQLQRLGAALNNPHAAEHVFSKLDLDLQSARRKIHYPKYRALIFRPGGLTENRPSFIVELLEHAGLTNAAAELSSAAWPRVNAETLAQLKPDLILFIGSSKSESALAYEKMQHAVFQRYVAQKRILYLPVNLFSCGSSASVQALELLIQKVQKFHLEQTKPDRVS